MADIVEKVEDYVTSSKISTRLLMDKLSEFLAVERGGIKLYQAALQIVQDREVSQKFREFFEQTKKHEAILTRVIRELGGDPDHVSPGAAMAEKKAMSLLETMTNSDGLNGRAAELDAIENIVIAETQDHADWEMIGRSRAEAITRRFATSSSPLRVKSSPRKTRPQLDQGADVAPRIRDLSQ